MTTAETLQRAREEAVMSFDGSELITTPALDAVRLAAQDELERWAALPALR